MMMMVMMVMLRMMIVGCAGVDPLTRGRSVPVPFNRGQIAFHRGRATLCRMRAHTRPALLCSASALSPRCNR
uniref:Putative secreted protein n=1 Tax=Anopheles marajoara TaxID=58244 RepID=A0A2M4CDS2_9DIPT